MAGKAPRAGCILVNTDTNKVLIVHETVSGFWGFPKGSKKRNETMIDAALRELKEETGKVADPSRISAIITYRRNKLYVIKGRFPVQCTVDGREIDKYDWTTLSELDQMNISQFTRRCLRQANTVI